MSDTKELEKVETWPDSTITVNELADVMGVTPRRVNQMLQDGYLIKRGPGLVDAPHAVIAVLGARWLGLTGANVSAHAKAGIGWLMGHQDKGVGPDALEAWHALAERWGIDRVQATAELFNAAALLGKHCPIFRSNVGPVSAGDR
jgi:hypothetical protein